MADLGVAVGGDVMAAHLQNAAPVGSICMYVGLAGTATAVAVPGSGTTVGTWLFCTGTAVSRATYATLFAVTGTAFGSGNGSTTFNIPDLRGRIPMGQGTGAGDGSSAATGTPTGTALSARTVAEWGGTQSHMPAHTHSYVNAQSGSTASTFNTGGNGTFSNAATSGSTGTAVAGANSELQPYLVVNFIIRASYY